MKRFCWLLCACVILLVLYFSCMIIFYFKTDCNLFFNFLLSLATSGGMEATMLLKVGEVLFGLKHLQTRMFREY